MKEHDVEEFIREITRHQSVMTAFIRSLLPGYCDPRDVLQEVNITLWKKKEQYEPGSNFKAWAFKVAKYHVLNERRKLKRSHVIVFDDDLLEAFSAEGENLLSNEMLDDRMVALRRCLEGLSERHRSLLKLRYSKDVSIEQYAESQNRKAGTLRATLRQIRIKLKDCVMGRLREVTP
ncbi:RNA polymerase sigma-70 factor, ECF subfamily [Rubritalea squalenifaciens DSM 18772]|uniref:RNA polymerase sigma-70 factor, ECF subfamily n=1 Tax=Rubritalea squalenifaciens DSM 18772 TaxID=1123071 RepID=A0A1M6DWB1_9BACT|nr:sigma-70 family RNA polymerase sigma factor [Rubritalea squalenifaciens]SHI77410.1 RNA polymerase sigma-70 factor, ECF subfamily [Rubritalea squalenifaciens DSM 18772]